MVVDAIGVAGGLAIVWHPSKVTLEHFITTPFSISAQFILIDSGMQGVISNIYRPANPRKKPHFLADQRHWILGGDFNLITNLQEKKRGTRKLDAHSLRFNSIIHNLKLVDVRTHNDLYTWNNKRIGTHAVASRLDRFLLSKSIVTFGGIYNASLLPSAGSDHWPISLTWQG